VATEKRIHYVAGSSGSGMCGVVDSTGTLRCVDLHRKAWIGAFPVAFDIGGARLAVDDKGTLCVSAAYQRHGVAAYRLPDGQILWRRPDLKKVQEVVWDKYQGRCILVRDRASAEVIDPADGRSIQKIPRVRAWYPSPYEAIALREDRLLRLLEVPALTCRFTAEKESFASLAACFSRDAVFVSEAGGALRAFCLESGKLRWRLTHPPHQHYVSVAFCESMNCLYGIRWQFKAGMLTVLDRISPDSGEVSNSLVLSEDAATGAFAARGAFYVGLDLRVVATATGEIFSL
jgi:hypothetical protein